MSFVFGFHDVGNVDLYRIRAVISRRKKDRAELESFDAVVETYESNILGLNP